MAGAGNHPHSIRSIYDVGQGLTLLGLLLIVLSLTTGGIGCGSWGCSTPIWFRYLVWYPGLALVFIGLVMSLVGFVSR